MHTFLILLYENEKYNYPAIKKRIFANSLHNDRVDNKE